jgi:hypothetical protein
MKKTSKSSIKKYQTGGVKPYAGGVKPYAGGVTLAGSNKTVKKPNTGQYAPSTVNTSNNRPIQNAPKVTIKPTTKPTTKPVAKSKTKPTTKPVAKSKTGSTKPKKQSQDFISKVNRYIDDLFRDDVNKAVSSTNKKIQKKLDPIRKGVSDVNKKIQKKLDPVRNTVGKANTQTQKLLDSVRNSIYDKPSTKTTKPATTKQATTKPTTKPATEAKTTPKQVTKPAVTKPAVTKPAAKTVSQMWVEKTGTPWSEAKKQGFSDGTAASNMDLMKKLQSGRPSQYTRAYTGPDYSGDAAAEAAYGEAKTTMRKGGRVKSKMKSKKK